MLQDIERIQYYRDDQIPRTLHYKAVHQRFTLDKTKCGIVNVDGPAFVVLLKNECFLIFRSDSKDMLQQIWDFLKQVSISMSMMVPLKKSEKIISEEQFAPTAKDKKLEASFKNTET